MKPNSYRYRINRYLVCLAVLVLALPAFMALAGTGNRQSSTSHKVFIAFGFHVNLYHSFRNDTNDESGFGKDIRIIRKIIKTLDRYNADGVPVRGVWDFDNFFSLQEILPRYAPDIIENIQRRVRENGDEVILMSYNNGLVSAMTEQELDDAVRWSISNPWHSGVQDLFGRYSPIVRPQEMMTTPGNFSVYKKHGVQAVSLYYSATPFDSFRVFSRRLSRTEAHNPIRYRHPETGEEMVVIPTYHFGDLVEHVSLKQWVKELQHLQNTGEIKQDALIFINYDADSELWEGVDLPWLLSWLPNAGGLGALVDEVQDMRGVRFTTLADYLADHQPAGTFYFSQDTADGSFNGYNSWAEKANVSHQWTAIERNRHVRTAALRALPLFEDVSAKSQLENLITFSDMTRLRALSTTNFGMATPFVSRQRDLVMAGLVADLEAYSDQMQQLIADGLHDRLAAQGFLHDDHAGLRYLDTVMLLGTDSRQGDAGHRFIRIRPPAGFNEGMQLALVRPDGTRLPATVLPSQVSGKGHAERITLFIAGPDLPRDGMYYLCEAIGTTPTGNPARPTFDAGVLSNGRVAVRLENNGIEGIYLNGERQAQAGSLTPYFRWSGQTYTARGSLRSQAVSADGRSAAIRVSGPFPGPEKSTRNNGWMDYRYTVVEQLPYLFVQGAVSFPSTVEDDMLKAATPGLTRRADMKWQEAAPAEIRFAAATSPDDPIRVMKENYLGIATQYALDYHRFSPVNLNLDNVNNHITASYMGLNVGRKSMAVAMDNGVRSNFAFAPLKTRYQSRTDKLTVCANPFGTYHGRQYQPTTWGNGTGFDVTLLTGEQFAGAGPTYNGVSYNFSLMIAFFNGDAIPRSIAEDMTDFSRSPMVVSTSGALTDRWTTVGRSADDSTAAPKGLVAAYRNGVVQFGWDNDYSPLGHYRIYCGSSSGEYDAVYPAIGNSLRITQLVDGQPFVQGRQYFAAIEKVTANGRVSQRAPEIRFTIDSPPAKRPDVPLALELKVLWANLQVIFGAFRSGTI